MPDNGIPIDNSPTTPVAEPFGNSFPIILIEESLLISQIISSYFVIIESFRLSLFLINNSSFCL